MDTPAIVGTSVKESLQLHFKVVVVWQLLIPSQVFRSAGYYNLGQLPVRLQLIFNTEMNLL